MFFHERWLHPKIKSIHISDFGKSGAVSHSVSSAARGATDTFIFEFFIDTRFTLREYRFPTTPSLITLFRIDRWIQESLGITVAPHTGWLQSLTKEFRQPVPLSGLRF
jgi:hypothetical protein